MTDYFNVRLTDDEIRAMSSLGLAHLGDAVFELMVRTWLTGRGKATARSLHRAAVGYVSAPAQARATARLLPALMEEELAVFKRGRNARVNSVPQGATYEQYHAATGLETVFGYLYLKGDRDRLNELFDMLMG